MDFEFRISNPEEHDLLLRDPNGLPSQGSSEFEGKRSSSCRRDDPLQDDAENSRDWILALLTFVNGGL